MIFYILNKILGNSSVPSSKNKNIIFLLSIGIYVVLFNNYYFQYYSSLIIITDLYILYNYSNTKDRKKKIDINKYKTLIKDLYTKFNDKQKKSYEKNYKPENFNLEHTIKHTLNNINKNI